MGLINSLTREAEDVARRADVQEQFAKRRVARYNNEVAQLKGEMAPHEATLKDYNTQVEGFKNSAVHRTDNNALFQIVGYLTTYEGLQPYAYGTRPGGAKVAQPADRGRPLYTVEDNLNNSGGPAAAYDGTYAGVPSGGYLYSSGNGLTVRGADGTAIEAMPTNNTPLNSQTPSSYYFTKNDQPFVAPLTHAQIESAANANSALLEKGSAVNALNDKGVAIQNRNEQAQTTASREVERLNTSVAHQKQSIQAEQAPQQGSVFEQTTPFQSIFDWLKS